MKAMFEYIRTRAQRILHYARASCSALCLVLVLSGCEGSTIIVNELEERYANEIIVFLAGHHITAEKSAHVSGGGGGNQATTWDVAVKKSEKMRALTLLNNNGLPRRHSQNLLSLFQKQGLVSSEMEERIRYEAGVAAQIASTIRKIDGVLDADIQISFPVPDSMPGQNKIVEPTTASVYVKHQGVLDNPNSHLVLKIKQLVASAIPGLDFDRVTVISDRAVFNDPLSIALSKEPDVVTVWGVRVIKAYVFRLQIIFITLITMIALSLSAFGWILWKVSRVLPHLGGIKSLIRSKPWQLDTPSQASSGEQASHQEAFAAQDSSNTPKA